MRAIGTTWPLLTFVEKKRKTSVYKFCFYYDFFFEWFGYYEPKTLETFGFVKYKNIFMYKKECLWKVNNKTKTYHLTFLSKANNLNNLHLKFLNTYENIETLCYGNKILNPFYLFIIYSSWIGDL